MKPTLNITKGLSKLIVAMLFSAPVNVSASDMITTVSDDNQTILSYSINYSPKEKGMVVVRKKGCKDWSYILQDSTGAIISSRSCLNETDTIFGLTEGNYTISEINAYGVGESKDLTVSHRFRTKFCNIPSEERSMIQLLEESERATDTEHNSNVDFTILKMKVRMNESIEKNNLL